MIGSLIDPEVNALAAQLQRAFEHRVLPVELFDHLAEGLSGERNLIRSPAVDHHEGLDILVVADAIEHLDGTREPAGRPQHVERGEQHLAGHVAQRVDDPVDVEVALIGPLREQAHAFEVHGGREAGSVAHRSIGVGGQVEHAQGAAQAVAKHVQFGLAGVLLDPFDAGRDARQRVVVEGERTLLRQRRAPVDQVDVVALLDEELDHALTRREVEDVGLADERGDDQQREAVDLCRLGTVVIQLHRALAQDRVLGRRAGLRVVERDVLETHESATQHGLDGRADLIGDVVGHVAGEVRGCNFGG